MLKRYVLLSFLIAGMVSAKVTFLEESTVTDEGLYFWYPNGAKAFHWSDEISPRQDCFTVVNDYIFFGWYKGGMTDRQLMISRKKVGSPNWVTVGLPYKNTLVPGRTWGDSHRTVAVGVSKIDGTVHIFYDHHNDPLKYVVSKKNKAFAPDSEFTVSAFEPTRGNLAVGESIRITYPKLTQNDEGKLILNYRKGSAVGGNEMVHVYDGDVWTRSTQVTRGGGIPFVEEEDKNYAYGKPYYNNGNVYYAFSVRWKAKQAQGVFNEGVYLAKCGPDMTSRWEDPKGVKHDLPIQDYSPFLIDLPASKDGEGSTSGPDLVVSEDGGVHVTYYGRGSGFRYTYSRRAGESSFTKHTGAMMTGRAWNNRFYTIETAGSSIRITSGEPGTVNYVTELVHNTNRRFARSESYLADGKLYLIAAESKESDKREIYCYVFQLPSAPAQPPSDKGPTISAIEDQSILVNTATEALAFTVGDDLTPPGLITLAASSSNTALVPEANIVFSGSGADRMVTVTPRPDESGSADISVHANDGELITSSTFNLTVLPSGTVSRTIVYNSPGIVSWTCPPGVRVVQVQCWGGGGAGGSADSVGTSNVGGGGGGGGAYARKLGVPVTSGMSYRIAIPAAARAPAGAADGARFNGESVSFVGDDRVSVTAAGGQGGECRVASSDTSGTGGAGGSTGSVGDVNFAGGNGAQGGVRDGGGGGGGAGASISGGNGSGTSAGSGGTDGEGTGGTGRSGDNNGGAGQNPGGGGGGAKSQSGKGGEPRSGGSGGLGQIVLTYVQMPVDLPNTALENWREDYFDTTEGFGIAADTYDANFDGESNLLEFVTGQDPHAGTLVSTPVEMKGNEIEFRYTRSKAALADGMIFKVEWSDTLLEDSWTDTGVAYELDPARPMDSEVEHWIARVPIGVAGRRFARLKASSP